MTDSTNRRIEIYDTTLRDGTQGEGVAFSLVEKLKIAEHLDQLGVDFIEGGYPLSNPKDAAFFEEVAKLPLAHARICAFGMTRRKGMAPADDPGKSLIQSVYNMAKNNELGGRVAFVEDYEMHMARYLTQGVDIWLNTPRRPREASGTSGMKAAANGVPNLSILDGWWIEGYNGANGWAIGKNIDYTDQELQDNEDANSIYRLLEDEIVPLYYDRDHDGVARGWAEIMRESIRSNSPQFSMTRMIKEYTTKLYIPAMNDDS